MVLSKKIYIVFWIIVWLVVFDCCINILFPYPVDTEILPNAFQEYFEYGRSVEGKIKRKLPSIERQDATQAKGGWLDTNRLKCIPIEGADSGKLITIYGMSHANAFAQAMIKIASYRIRNITTGGAPPNWSYAAFQMDHKLVHSDVAVLSVMTIGVADMLGTSGMTAFFEHPYTYTFPHYEISDNGLTMEMPPFYTRDGFISCFRDPVKLKRYTQWLSQNDAFYSEFLFKQGLTDYSVIVRALKRVYFTTFVYSKTEKIYTIEKGFNESCNEVNVLKRIIHEFAQTARTNNIVPFIYIVNNQLCNDDMYQLLKPQLEADKTPFLSTHIICPPSNPAVYGSDGHFTIEKDHELALAAIKIISGMDSVAPKQIIFE